MFRSVLLLSFYFQSVIGDSSSCIFDVGNGQTLDIRPLGFSDGQKAKYDNIAQKTPSPLVLSWNGCFPYKKSDGGDCVDAAACYTDKRSGSSKLIAKQENVEFDRDHHPYVLVYHDRSTGTQLSVFLTCIDSGEDQIGSRQDDANTFYIDLSSQCCCPGKCQYKTSSGGISGGAVFLIIVFVFIFIYIVGGMLFLRFGRSASGYEMIPNRQFWIGAKDYVFGGFRYSIGVIRHRSFRVDYNKV